MLSQYIVLDKFHLMNTRWAVILPAIFSTFAVFLIYRGFADIPNDVADSARIDGANEWQILRYIGLPLGKHGILSCLVLSFFGTGYHISVRKVVVTEQNDSYAAVQDSGLTIDDMIVTYSNKELYEGQIVRMG